MQTVREFMTFEPTTIQANGSLGEAARLMRDRQVGLLPVMEGNEIIGVVTDRDLVVRGLTQSPDDLTVGAICTQTVTSIHPDCTEAEAADTMESAKVRRLPVEEDGELIGMISVGDLAVRANPRRAGEVLEWTGPSPDQSPPAGSHWPGEGLTRNTLSNEDTVASPRLPDEIQRDISQTGTHPAP